METNSKRLLEAIPDWQDFMRLAGEITALSYKKMVADSRIKTMESDNFKMVMSDPKYFINGKAVAVSYYENAYGHSGVDNSILPIREEYAQICSELELKRIEYEVYKQMLDTWRTLSANERSIS
jgi:hypothetical protein